MKRRTFLGIASAAGLSLATLPRLVGAKPVATGRTLILVELRGGNDGLNTVVPFADDRYYALRPRIGVKRKDVVKLNDSIGLHPSLRPLMKTWNDGQLAVVQGLGYPSPNRSHFRSIDIWETASRAEQFLDRGWLSTVVDSDSDRAIDALVVGAGDDGPLRGTRVLTIDEPRRLFNQMRGLEHVEPVVNANAALEHVVETQNQLVDAVDELRRRLRGAQALDRAVFGKGKFARQMQVAASLLTAGFAVPVIKVGLNGFDTHVGQPRKHERLLKDLADGIAGLRATLMKSGQWKDVLVVTYSEFGRRPRENAGAGTDHGTAAPHFVLGGRVNGGVAGRHPSLEAMKDNGDLVHTVDFRRLYRTIAYDWFGTDAFNRYKSLNLITS